MKRERQRERGRKAGVSTSAGMKATAGAVKRGDKPVGEKHDVSTLSPTLAARLIQLFLLMPVCVCKM